VFSVGDGVYVTLADENYSQSTKTFFTFAETQAISEEGWHVLDKDEWTYLLVTRDAGLAAADQRNGIGTVAGVHGLIIIPDNWIQPSGVPALTGGSSEGWNTNSYDAAEWTAMAAAGAVFLPAAGYSTDGTTAEEAGDDGTYWSSSENSDNTDKGYAIQFENTVIHDRQSRDKTMYYSVRLAQTVTVLDENDDASTFSTKFAAAGTKDYALMIRSLYKDGYFNTICLPFDVSSIAASPLAGAEIFTFEGGNVVETGTGTELQLQLSPLVGDVLSKGVPYMIRWTSGDDLSFLKFDDIAWGTGSDAGQTGDAKVTFRGFYPMTHIEELNHYNLFLGADDVLYWPIADGKSMKGFRAYWLVDPGQPSPAPVYRGMPASLHIRRITSVTTGLENEEIKTKSAKLLREGRVVLLINGEPYSIGGQKL
jgi:uncharacterized protein (TIGR02145 family)